MNNTKSFKAHFGGPGFSGGPASPFDKVLSCKIMGNLAFLDFLEGGYTESTNLGISWDCRCWKPGWLVTDVTARLDLDLLIDQWKLLPGLTMQVSGSGSFKTTWFRLLDWLHTSKKPQQSQIHLKEVRFLPHHSHFSLKKTHPANPKRLIASDQLLPQDVPFRGHGLELLALVLAFRLRFLDGGLGCFSPFRRCEKKGYPLVMST